MMRKNLLYYNDNYQSVSIHSISIIRVPLYFGKRNGIRFTRSNFTQVF